LGGGIDGVAPAVGGDLEAIFEEGDASANKNHEAKRLGFEFQMTIPGDGHEEVGEREEGDGEKSLIGWVVHIGFEVYLEKVIGSNGIGRIGDSMPLLRSLAALGVD
jgi:hypothetical protein